MKYRWETFFNIFIKLISGNHRNLYVIIYAIYGNNKLIQLESTLLHLMGKNENNSIYSHDNKPYHFLINLL